MCFEFELAAFQGVPAHHPGSFSYPFPPSFHCLFSVTGACFPVWGLMAGLSGFASHGLHLGAGCQYWKLLDVSGTQPPLNDAVVKFVYCIPSKV